MKERIISVFVFLFVIVMVNAQDEEKKGYQFETIKDLDATSVKDQYRSGTCWSFSGLSFIESEMLKAGKSDVDLSEMFVVRHCYSDKALKYIRLHGSLEFGPGGSFDDVLYVFKNYGFVPESAYSGLQYGEEKHVHSEMDHLLKVYVDGVLENKNKKLTPVWHKGFNGILDAYLGELPESFDYEGKSFTPKSFTKDVVGLNPDDYVMLTSYTHHPFYSKFIIEVPDNWVWGEVYNLPLEELKEVFYNAIETGYTIAWGSDVSEKGFSFKNGVAIVADEKVEEVEGTERSKWESMSLKEKEALLYSFDGPVKEKVITQKMRQEGFDNYQTTDDHGMHITGLVKDQKGNKYFKVKNSWNTNNIYNGYFYASEAFVLLKTMDIMINKNAIPKEIRKKLGIK